jgi:hypothetical protein
LPVPERGAALGEQFLRFLADDMRANSGVDGLVADSASRTLSKPKTATEISRDSAGGSYFMDNQAENCTDLLNEYVQAVFEESQARLQPNTQGMMEYERYVGNRIYEGTLPADIFRLKRSILVAGAASEAIRLGEQDNLLKAFEITGMMQEPAMMALRLKIAIKLCRKLGVDVPEELDMSTDELLAANPQVEAMAVNNFVDRAAQDPNVIQLFQQGGQLNADAQAV